MQEDERRGEEKREREENRELRRGGGCFGRGKAVIVFQFWALVQHGEHG